MVYFSSLLSGHLALVNKNDPLVSASSVSDDDASHSNSAILVQFEQPRGKAGLLVTAELEAAMERVRKNVGAISKACRARNMKYRDITFDLEEDEQRCLHGLDTPKEQRFEPSDVQRAGQMFRDPQFFVDGASWSDVVQGALGDCWFLSGCSAVATMPELVEKFCVARDEQVGVYGFTFQRNGDWTDVIIDDLLYTAIPKYDELSQKEQMLYHEDRDRYNRTARLGSKSLLFAKSGTMNETWVPLLEKAYAKLHGDYASLAGGHVGDAIEDLTGGVSTVIHVKDILDVDEFWNKELVRASGQDRLFGCSIYDLKTMADPRDPEYRSKTVNGLHTAHAYTIIKAVEYRGKRFLRLRNPWGNSEWTGRWADGSKEWTPEWCQALEPLGHSFGDDGSFVMEYSDFLDVWTLLHRTVLFDPSWVVSSLWINAKIRPPSLTWDYGDISFTFVLPERTPTIIVLSKLDDRYARGILDTMRVSLDFVVYKKGDSEPVATSAHSIFYSRSVNVEIDLNAGEYIVHVRVDSEFVRPKDYFARNLPKWNVRKWSQVMSQVSITGSILANFPADEYDQWLPRPLSMFAGRDLQQIQRAVDAKNPPIQSPEPIGTRYGRQPSHIPIYVSSEPGAYHTTDSEDESEEDMYAPLTRSQRTRKTSVVEQPSSTQIVDFDIDTRTDIAIRTPRSSHSRFDSLNRAERSTVDPSITVVPSATPSRASTTESFAGSGSIATEATTLMDQVNGATGPGHLIPKANSEPELAIGLRVFTQRFDIPVKIDAQTRHGKLYPWRGI